MGIVQRLINDSGGNPEPFWNSHWVAFLTCLENFPKEKGWKWNAGCTRSLKKMIQTRLAGQSGSRILWRDDKIPARGQMCRSPYESRAGNIAACSQKQDFMLPVNVLGPNQDLEEAEE